MDFLNAKRASKSVWLLECEGGVVLRMNTSNEIMKMEGCAMFFGVFKRVDLAWFCTNILVSHTR